MEPLSQTEAMPLPNGRHLNKFFKALSDETRRGILRLLDRREYTVGEIVGNFHLSQPTISRHLSVLKEADLVSDQRRGQHVVYSLRVANLARAAEQFFGEFRELRRPAGPREPVSMPERRIR